MHCKMQKYLFVKIKFVFSLQKWFLCYEFSGISGAEDLCRAANSSSFPT